MLNKTIMTKECKNHNNGFCIKMKTICTGSLQENFSCVKAEPKEPSLMSMSFISNKSIKKNYRKLRTILNK
jgi:hypothetical protein